MMTEEESIATLIHLQLTHLSDFYIHVTEESIAILINIF